MVIIICYIFCPNIKIPIHFIVSKKWDWSLITSTGGMPSSHSAAVTSLAIAVGYEAGFNSPVFSVAFLFSIITMYDASGVRYQAGRHAAMINQIRMELKQFFVSIKHWREMDENEKTEELKTLLGHIPSEVFFGAVTGICISVIYYSFFK